MCTRLLYISGMAHQSGRFRVEGGRVGMRLRASLSYHVSGMAVLIELQFVYPFAHSLSINATYLLAFRFFFFFDKSSTDSVHKAFIFG